MAQSVTSLLKMQGGPYKATVTGPLARHYPQMIMTMLAGVAMNDVFLDVLVTDGTHFTLYRVREENILVYEDLTPTQVNAALVVIARRCWSCVSDQSHQRS